MGKYEVWYENTEEFSEIKKEVWTNHAYYIDEIEPKNIVDIGAHIGLTTLYFAQIYSEARIVAYEPDENNFKILEKNIIQNSLQNIEINNLAVGVSSGDLKLQLPIYPDEWRSGVGIMEGGWRGVLHTKPKIVSAISIREILREKIDLLKIDIEGMEYEVLEAADLKKIENLIVEAHPRKNKKIAELERIIINSGMKLERRVDESKYGNGLVMLYGRRTQ